MKLLMILADKLTQVTFTQLVKDVAVLSGNGEDIESNAADSGGNNDNSSLLKDLYAGLRRRLGIGRKSVIKDYFVD